MDETGQQRQQQDSASKVGGRMAAIGTLVLAWGVLGMLFADGGPGEASPLAFLAVLLGGMVLVGGLVLRNLRR